MQPLVRYGEVSWGTNKQTNKHPMKKNVGVSSIHGGGLVGASSLWPTHFANEKKVHVSSIHGGGLVGAGSLWLTQVAMAMMVLNVRGVTWSSTNNKNPGNKNQGWKPIHQKYKANENTSRHNPKKKTKANNQQNLSTDLMQRGLTVTNVYNDNKENLRRKNYHLSQIG